MASFAASLRVSCADEWQSLMTNPFTALMADATLPLECFRYDIAQDLMYLRT